MSRPPDESPADEPSPSGSAADEPADPATGDEPGETRNDPPSGTSPGDTPSPTSGTTPHGPGTAPQEQVAAPWWAQGQEQPPPPGGQPPPPPPYQPPQQPPWAYGRQMPAGPPRPVGADASGGRDRISLHLIWEGVLALIAVLLMVAVAAGTNHHNVTAALAQAGYIGLLSVGMAFSLRTGAPNLAIGSILGLTSTLAAHLVAESGWSKPVALFVAILLATFIGLLLGVLTAGLSVPSWALTLGAVAIIQAITLGVARNRLVPAPFGGSYSTAMWYGIFFVLSVGGGALWLVPGVRSALSTARRAGEPGRWTDPRGALGVVAGLTGSSFLAGLAAIPMLLRFQIADANANGASLTAVALAAALLGGVSVFGRRGGVFGTLLGVTIVALVQVLVAYNGLASWVSTLVIGLAALLGLAVSRAIESVTDSMNRSRPAGAAPPPYAPPPPPPPPAYGG